MKTIDLQVKMRSSSGTKGAKAVRREGGIPAVVYGHGMEPLSLVIERKAFMQALHGVEGSSAVFNLLLDGGNLKESTCLIKDVQHNPVNEEINHIDFTVISMTETIQLEVALHPLNVEDAPGVKEGGVFDLVHHEVEIECLPTQIPAHIDVDVIAMKINDTIHVKDLILPEGVKVLLDDDEVVVAVHPPRVDKVEEEGAEGGEAEPQVIEKGKKPAEGEEEGK
ncbi:MAG: 50S ribosomal protein L25/general stress protein Ctc [Candidatus Omnitrophica bacterium]|nr:50S ribosomal protein L25/general stress protein Ctc [Candidatus Omnitrophota bacterium]